MCVVGRLFRVACRQRVKGVCGRRPHRFPTEKPSGPECLQTTLATWSIHQRKTSNMEPSAGQTCEAPRSWRSSAGRWKEKNVPEKTWPWQKGRWIGPKEPKTTVAFEPHPGRRQISWFLPTSWSFWWGKLGYTFRGSIRIRSKHIFKKGGSRWHSEPRARPADCFWTWGAKGQRYGGIYLLQIQRKVERLQKPNAFRSRMPALDTAHAAVVLQAGCVCGGGPNEFECKVRGNHYSLSLPLLPFRVPWAWCKMHAELNYLDHSLQFWLEMAWPGGRSWRVSIWEGICRQLCWRFERDDQRGVLVAPLNVLMQLGRTLPISCRSSWLICGLNPRTTWHPVLDCLIFWP